MPSVLEGEVRLTHLDWLDNMDNTSSHVFKALASLMEVELKQLLDKDKLHLHHMEEEKLQIHHLKNESQQCKGDCDSTSTRKCYL